MEKLLLICVLVLGTSFISEAQDAVKIEHSGEGSPLMFLPGFATPGNIWLSTVDHFPDRESLLVTYAGFGGLDPIAMPWYTQILDELAAYIRDRDLRNLTLVGHSMGGNLAVELAAELPEYISSLVIVDALSCMRELMMPGVPASALAYESPYNEQLLTMKPADFEAYLSQMATGMASGKANQDMLLKWMKEADKKTFVYGYTDLLKLDVRPQLKKLDMPVLILVAAIPFGPAALENMTLQYQELSHKAFEVAENSKHFIMLDDPDWFIDQLQTFLKK